MKKTLLVALMMVSATLTGCGGGGGNEPAAGWAWDAFFVGDAIQWRCRDKGNGQFSPDYACDGLRKNDSTWPTSGIQITEGPITNSIGKVNVDSNTCQSMSCAADRLPASTEHIDKVCATQMASYKIQLKSIQGGIALDYASIGATKPEIIDGVGIKNFTDVRDALWEASPYVAITKTKNIAADKSVHWSWNDQFHAGGTSDFSLFHAQFLREHDTQIYATLWKKTDFQWAVWVITKEGKCGSFNSENGNYKGLTVL